MSAAAANTNSSEAPKPDLRVRSNTPVIAATTLGMLAVLGGTIFGGVKPLSDQIADANDARELARADIAAYEVTRADLEAKRDKIIEQYDAIKLFVDRYPNAPQQDSLFQDIENAAIFATSSVVAISTDYPELLAEGAYTDGTVITPDQIVIGEEATEDTTAASATATPTTTSTSTAAITPGTAASDVADDATDVYPLGTIPLSLSADLDSTQAFEDADGTTYVASPYLGYFTYGGDTGRERLSLNVAADTARDKLVKSYFAPVADGVTASWDTVFSPNLDSPAYAGVGDIDDLSTQDLVSLYPAETSLDSVSVPAEWVTNNGFVSISRITRAAWLVQELQDSPGRAILVKFVSGGGSSIAISGQQFILRELSPLPEDIFGDLNGDGEIFGSVDPVTGELATATEDTSSSTTTEE